MKKSLLKLSVLALAIPLLSGCFVEVEAPSTNNDNVTSSEDNSQATSSSSSSSINESEEQNDNENNNGGNPTQNDEPQNDNPPVDNPPDDNPIEDNPVAPVKKDIKYHLSFEENIITNSGDKTINNASVSNEDHLTITNEKHKGLPVLSFSNTANNGSYINVPLDAIRNETTTIAMWVKLPNDVNFFNNKSTLFSVKWNDGYFYTSPFDTETWFGYSMITKINASDTERNLTLAPTSDLTHWHNTPVDGTLQSPMGAWQLIGFTFSYNGISVYQNGKLMYEFTGNYSFLNKNLSEFRIGSSSLFSGRDFNAKIADFRVYNEELTEKDYVNEFNLTYEDFLTTSYEFGSTQETMRNYDFTLRGNASLTTKDNRSVLYLDGQKTGSAQSSCSSIDLPNQTVLGHNQLTVSMDIFIVNSGARYQRLFEFSVKGQRYLSFFLGHSHSNDLTLQYVPDEEGVHHSATDTGYSVPTGKWVNITITANKQNGSIYVDGLKVAEADEFAYDPVILYYYPDLSVTVGRTDWYGDTSLNAYIDSFKMYSTYLSEKEVMQMNNLIQNPNDKQAIEQAMATYQIEYVSTSKLRLDKYTGDAVSLSYSSLSPDLVDNKGNIMPSNQDQEAEILVRFKRGEVTKNKIYTIDVKKKTTGDYMNELPELSKSSYDRNSYFDETMLSNIDYLFSLDVEKLLYNYRLNAGLNTNGATGYNGWISTSSGGAGQFETQYIGALARYTLSKPDYVSNTAPVATNTPYKRLKYMLEEIRKCQVAYAELYPDEAGYLSAFTDQCFTAIESGTTEVSDDGNGVHGTVPVGGVNAWVPFYMYHKNLMMCMDVYLYCQDTDVKALAKKVLIDASDWAYNEVMSLTDTQRSNVLRFEYGGMSEVMYMAYALTKNNKYLQVARFFEEESLMENMYNHVNVLKGLHANTTIPKFLSAAACYEATGDEYYKQVVINAWDIVTNEMTYANGGTSKDEHWEAGGCTSQCCYGAETCCSYNMLRLSDYLFRWTGEKKYADYFEKVFYNHIMASIDPATAGKTYPISTTFGYHKIYSAAVDAFWCCCCTGQETFAKLTYGNFYNNIVDGSLFVNMYNPITYDMGNDASIVISGDLFIDEKVNVRITKNGHYKLRLRMPEWTTPRLKLNGSIYQYEVENGYMIVERDWLTSDVLTVELPMDYYLEAQKGEEDSYALFYGPMMLVCNLGIQSGDAYISTSHTATYKNGNWVSYDGAYTGSVNQYLLINNGFENHLSDYITRSVVDGKLKFTFTANNQTVEFIPFKDCIYERYSMYMYYMNELPSINISGLTSNVSLAESNMTAYRSSNTTVCAASYSANSLTLSNELTTEVPVAEQKQVINNVNVNGDYELNFTLTSYSDREVNAGIYLGLTNPGNERDIITSLNIQFEKGSGFSTWNVHAYNFNQGFGGEVGSAGAKDSLNASIQVRLVVKDQTIYVFINNEVIPSFKLVVGGNYNLNGKIGIRNQAGSKITISNLTLKD